MNARVSYLYRLTQTAGPPKKIGRVYIGIRTCPRGATPLNDVAYLGSGTRICHAVRKYGAAAFRKDVLCIGSREYVIELERKIVTEEFIERRDTFNERVGGVNALILSGSARQRHLAALFANAASPEGQARWRAVRAKSDPAKAHAAWLAKYPNYEPLARHGG